MIGIGASRSASRWVVLDEVLGLLKWMRLPPLAVAIGIYLPMSATLPITLGAGGGALVQSPRPAGRAIRRGRSGWAFSSRRA